MVLLEVDPRGGEHPRGKPVSRSQPKPIGELDVLGAELIAKSIDVPQNLTRPFGQPLAVQGEEDALALTHEECVPELLLEGRYRMTYGARAYREHARGAPKVLPPRRLCKIGELIQFHRSSI